MGSAAWKMNKIDKGWVLTCFGTAVGAGVLFLPIKAGLAGIWPTLLMAAVICPLSHISHRGITRIVASCPKGEDIISAVESDLGFNASFALSILYFLSIVSICVSYATGLTNIVSSFLEHQMHLGETSRPLVTFVSLAVLTSVLIFSPRVLVAFTSIITVPHILLMVFISLYMIPHWNTSVFTQAMPDSLEFMKSLLVLLPLFVFAMNFSPVCSTVGAFYHKNHTTIEEAVGRSDKVILWTNILILVFIMFFVISMMLASSVEIFQMAQTRNIDTLSAISISFHDPIIRWSSPCIALLAIMGSYTGHFSGTREGLYGIVTDLMAWKNPDKRAKLNHKKIDLTLTGVLFVMLWFLAVYNPPILSVIGTISSPVIAVYLYLMPVFLMRKVPRLYIYRSPLGGVIFIAGLITLVANLIASYMP
ncbi:MAG: amino acid permease [Desulfovibrionaceae bacterium]|nr:amino acid permease [Desulfovibrionaceae bacterium]